MTRHSPITKVLHAALLLAVAHQLLLVALVERPRGAFAGNVFFAWHERVGLLTFGIVAAFWLWTLVRRGETTIGAFFPWFSTERRRAVWIDLRAHVKELRRFRLRHVENERALASATHGLGLLAVSAMAATGTAMALGGDTKGILLESHQLLANLMWAYVVAHASIALVHDAQGHDVLRRMFRPTPGQQ